MSDAVDLLHALVATPSPSRRERAAVDVLLRWMLRHGFDAQRDGVGNAVGTRGNGPCEILLLGHIDTFPGELPVRIENGILHGRGSVDAKGPLAAFAAAAARVSVPAGWQVTVVGAVEEESWTSRGARRVVADRKQAGSTPVAVVAGEPSRWDRITLGYRGSVELLARLTVPFAHSAGNVPLPAERAVELWQAIEAFVVDRNGDHSGPEFERHHAALRSIRTGTVGGFGRADLTVGLRLPPGVGVATATEQLRSHLDGVITTWGPGTVLSLRFRGAQEAYRAPKSTPLVSAFVRAIRAGGGDPRFVVKTGTADLNVVGQAWPGVPMAAYGPGDSALDHTPDEHLNLAEYESAIGVLERTITELVGGAGRTA